MLNRPSVRAVYKMNNFSSSKLSNGLFFVTAFVSLQIMNNRIIYLQTNESDILSCDYPNKTNVALLVVSLIEQENRAKNLPL